MTDLDVRAAGLPICFEFLGLMFEADASESSGGRVEQVAEGRGGVCMSMTVPANQP